MSHLRLVPILTLILALLAVTSAGQVAASSYPLHSNLEALADEATDIIRGTMEETSTTRERGTQGRGHPGHVVSTIRVEEVLKGQVEDERITVGEVNAMSRLEQPPGTQVVFFLKKVDPTAPRSNPEASPYGYFNVSGPQGRFLVEEGRIAPQGSRWVETTTLYEDMPVEEFLGEVREVLGTGVADVTNGQSLAASLVWGAGTTALLAGIGGLGVAYVRRR